MMIFRTAIVSNLNALHFVTAAFPMVALTRGAAVASLAPATMLDAGFQGSRARGAIGQEEHRRATIDC